MANTRRFEIEVLGDTSNARRALADLESAGTKHLNSLANMAKAAVGAFALTEVAQGVKSLVAAAEESQRVTKITEQVIRSTGEAAGVTAKQVADLADAMSRKTGVDDEAIMSAQNVLLTFKNLHNTAGEGNQIFDRTSKAMLDLSTVFGGLDSSALQLGKALNDPVAGLGKLQKVGVNFTFEQRELVKSLVATGDVLGAQKVMLAEIESQVGGTAEASATASDKMRVAWGNLQEDLGEKLLPVVTELSDWFVDEGIPAIDNAVGWLEDKLGPAFAALGDWINDEWPTITATFNEAVDEMGSAISGLIEVGEGVVEFFQGLFQDDLDKAWADAQAHFADAWAKWSGSGLTETVAAMGKTFADWVAKWGPKVDDAFWAMLKAVLIDAPSAVMAKAQDLGVDIGKKIGEGVANQFLAYMTKAINIANAAVDKLPFVNVDPLPTMTLGGGSDATRGAGKTGTLEGQWGVFPTGSGGSGGKKSVAPPSTTKPKTVTITVHGQSWTVAEQYAATFKAFLNDAYNMGLISGGKGFYSSGGYVVRPIAGSSTLSNHSYGAAVDISGSGENYRTNTSVNETIARQLAAKYGLTWGGDWKDGSKDYMHFEVRGANKGQAATILVPGTGSAAGSTVTKTLGDWFGNDGSASSTAAAQAALAKYGDADIAALSLVNPTLADQVRKKKTDWVIDKSGGVVIGAHKKPEAVERDAKAAAKAAAKKSKATTTRSSGSGTRSTTKATGPDLTWSGGSSSSDWNNELDTVIALQQAGYSTFQAADMWRNAMRATHGDEAKAARMIEAQLKAAQKTAKDSETTAKESTRTADAVDLEYIALKDLRDAGLDEYEAADKWRWAMLAAQGDAKDAYRSIETALGNVEKATRDTGDEMTMSIEEYAKTFMAGLAAAYGGRFDQAAFDKAMGDATKLGTTYRGPGSDITVDLYATDPATGGTLFDAAGNPIMASDTEGIARRLKELGYGGGNTPGPSYNGPGVPGVAGTSYVFNLNGVGADTANQLVDALRAKGMIRPDGSVVVTR